MDILNTIQTQAKAVTAPGSTLWERPATVQEIKVLLEDSSDSKVLDGLRKLMALVSMGGKAIELFPQVVKLVASQHPEVKRVVHRYLIQYAELEPQMTLLAINLLKKDLGSSNQLLRAQALRALSSLRVKMILPVVVQSVVNASKDSSPYVRKAAAHAVTKVMSLDPGQREAMEEVVEKLLTDRSTLVIGSAAAAFNHVCPERFDMIHANYRRLCEMLIDVDEWGQVALLQLLTRYARTQFMDPDKERPKKPKKEEKGVEEGEAPEETEETKEDEDDDYLSPGGPALDPDHRMLLDAAFPLLQSSNAAVVMGVVALYRYLAPRAERPKIGKALVRLVSKGREVSHVVLEVILSLAKSDPGIFQPHLGDFFIRASDPTFVRTIKLQVLTLLANDSNIDRILRELKFYTTQSDPAFVTATIKAIAACAVRLPDVTERCLLQLMQLLASKREHVVAESVVVIKQLLQMPLPPASDGTIVNFDEAIIQITRLFDDVTQPSARASIVWIVGEYVDKVKDYAPDVLRRLAKNFSEESDEVKIQTLNLAAKLVITNPEPSAILAQYVLNLAKFDLNFDIRDKARLLRVLLFDNSEKKLLADNAKRFIITKKPAPPRPGASDESGAGVDSADVRDGLGTLLTVDSLSFIMHHRVPGYNPLPDFALEPTDPTLRRPPNAFQPLSAPTSPAAKVPLTEEAFYGEDEYYGEEEYYEEGDFYGDDGFYDEGYGEDEYYEEGYEEGYGEGEEDQGAFGTQ